MDWQDSLRRLDARLAKGEISTTEYRKTRDEILAEASSGVHPKPAAKPDQQDVPFPATTAPSGEMTQVVGDQDATQVVRVSTAQQQPDADETQVVARTTDADDTQVVEQTQVIAADPELTAAPRSPATGTPTGTLFPVPQGSPPATDFGPTATGGRPTPVQGREVFSTAKSSPSGTRKAALGLVAMVLVVALAGTAVWWFLLRDDGNPAATPPADTTTAAPTTTAPTTGQTTTTAPTTSTTSSEPTQPADIERALPRLPGKTNPNSDTMTLTRAVKLKLISAHDAELFRANGVTEVVYRAARKGNIGFMMLVGRTGGTDNATAAADGIHQHLLEVGFNDADITASGDPAVFHRTDDLFRTYGAVYAAGDLCVQTGVSQRLSGNEKALRKEFKRLLDSMVGTFPPT